MTFSTLSKNHPGQTASASNSFLRQRPFRGRSLADYEGIFEFSQSELAGLRILDLRAGASSFAIEATLLGALVVAVDPSYRYGLEALRDQYRCSMDFQSNARGAERFFVDFRAGIAAGRYRASEVHALPFAQRSFDCVFCHKEALENLSGRERSKLVDELRLIGQGTVLLPKAFPGRAAL